MTSFAQTLRAWRGVRRLSQLDLAGEAEVSARHISFLETGRARPSREMVERLARALDLPLAARNQLLTHAGYAARYAKTAFTDAAMQPIRHAIDHMLTRHAPYPALAIDRIWTVLRMNAPARVLFGPVGFKDGDSLLGLMMGETLPPLIENWPVVAQLVAQRLRLESSVQGGVQELEEAAHHLAKMGGPVSSSGPVIPTIYRLGPHRLSLFATVAQFGTPDDLTLDDLKIELYFPADAATDEALRQLARDGQEGLRA